MSTTYTAIDINELYKFANDHGIVEIVTRRKNGTMREYIHLVISRAESDSKKKAAQRLGEASGLLPQYASKLMNLEKVSMAIGIADLVLEAVNLCVTVAGFKIINKRMNDVMKELEKVGKTIREIHDVDVEKLFDEVVLTHADMLDRLENQKPFTTDQYMELVNKEYSLLNTLYRCFMRGLTADSTHVLYLISSLSSMLAATIMRFDEAYYFENRNRKTEGSRWHPNHERWMGIYKDLMSEKYQEQLQDYMFIERKFSQFETDLFVTANMDSYCRIIKYINDQHELLEKLDDRDLYESLKKAINNKAREDVEVIINNAEDISPDDRKQLLQALAA
ncbi:MAG: hypothetical protein IKX74_04650 [Erysipelotrichaceae bacterium]|nr:hypothetical protein [Erysipelotrichaceae bacterium]